MGLLLYLFLLQAPILASTQPAATSTQDRLELEYDRHWETYLLAKHGCPDPNHAANDAVAKPIKKSDCTLPPRILGGEFEKAREIAKRMFGLKEK